MSTPAEMLPEAEALLDDPRIAEYRGSWLADQHEAAMRDLDPFMRTIADAKGKPIIESEASPHTTAFAMAVTSAILRRQRPERCCPHSKLMAPPPLFIFLGPGVTTCEPCQSRYIYNGVEDERCDICDAPTRIFTDFWLRMGPVMVQGDACSSCIAWLK